MLPFLSFYNGGEQNPRKQQHDSFLCIYNHRTTKTNQKYPSVNL